MDRRVRSHRLRSLLQRGFRTIEELRRELLTIEEGDPLTGLFAEFGDRTRVDWPRVALVHPELVALGEDVEIRSGVCIEAYAPAGSVAVRLGDRTVVGHNVRIVGVNGVEVAEDCGIGHGTTLADTIHRWTEVLDGVPASETGFVEGPPLRIERGAWIGNNCGIYGGVTIGERAIVAPGSVITRDVPPETMVSGNPGRRVPIPREPGPTDGSR